MVEQTEQAKQQEQTKQETKKENQDCIFCKIIRKELQTEIIDETNNFIAFPDANPKTKGHTLIIPKRHYVNLMDMPSDLANEMISFCKKIAAIRLREGAAGFNLIINNFPAAGQIVMHAHLHIIPRYEEEISLNDKQE